MSSSHTFRHLADKLFQHGDQPTATKDTTTDTNALGMHADSVSLKKDMHDTTWKHSDKPVELEKKPAIVETSAAFCQAGGPIIQSHTFAPVVETHIKYEFQCLFTAVLIISLLSALQC